MAHAHEPTGAAHEHGAHAHRGKAEALEPTMSLLRLSVVQRLIGAAVLIAVLWAGVAAILG